MRERIINSAISQVNKFGLRRFTVDDIAKDLGISKKTIYKYFDSKRDIINAAIEVHYQMEINGTLAAMETQGSWLEKLDAVINCHTQHKVPTWLLEELQRFFPEEWSKTERINKFKWERIQKVLSSGVESGEIRPGINPAVLELMLSKTIMELFDYNFLKQNDLTINQAMEEFKKILFYGIVEKIKG